MTKCDHWVVPSLFILCWRSLIRQRRVLVLIFPVVGSSSRVTGSVMRTANGQSCRDRLVSMEGSPAVVWTCLLGAGLILGNTVYFLTPVCRPTDRGPVWWHEDISSESCWRRWCGESHQTSFYTVSVTPRVLSDRILKWVLALRAIHLWSDHSGQHGYDK